MSGSQITFCGYWICLRRELKSVNTVAKTVSKVRVNVRRGGGGVAGGWCRCCQEDVVRDSNARIARSTGVRRCGDGSEGCCC
mmetsp:Transcript_7437/g.8578  ORF Transcript_7437/g.8578 Transcript_7437/m.8578 type:complete len:82 (+) Transcript_7437:424-669(+)